MKKHILIPLIVVTVVIATMYLRRQYKMNEQNKLDEYLILQKYRIEKHIKYNYESIGDITLETVEKTPMEEIYIDGNFIDISNNKAISLEAKVEPNIGV